MSPDYFDAARAAQLYVPRYGKVADEANRARRDFSPPARRGLNALFLVDCQIGFCHPDGGLYVPGAERDVERLCRFILRRAGEIDAIYCSLDTHYTFQIHTTGFWIDARGENPPPYTVITRRDLDLGRWRPYSPQIAVDLAASYLEQLESTGKYLLIAWPYHTQQGSLDHALTPLLSETLLYHNLLTGRRTCYIVKGEHSLTENYSAFSPEVQELQSSDGVRHRVGAFNQELFAELMQYDRIYIGGEASSHCVRFTVDDLARAMRRTDKNAERADAGRIFLLEDCMSPVAPPPAGPDFPAIARQALAQFAAAGMRIVRSTDEELF